MASKRDPYTREYFEANITRSVEDLAGAVSAWMTRDREQSVSEAYHLATRIKLISWTLAADTAALGRMSNQEYQRTPPSERPKRKRPDKSFDAVIARMNGVG